MSGVDVLAVLDFYIADWAEKGTWFNRRNELIGVRADLAELIDAAGEMNRLAKGPAGGVSQTTKKAIVARMCAALARVGGES